MKANPRRNICKRKGVRAAAATDAMRTNRSVNIVTASPGDNGITAGTSSYRVTTAGSDLAREITDNISRYVILTDCFII